MCTREKGKKRCVASCTLICMYIMAYIYMYTHKYIHMCTREKGKKGIRRILHVDMYIHYSIHTYVFTF